MYAVLSLLTTEPLDLPQHSELLIQADVMEALEDLNELPEIRTVFKEDIYGYPLTTELIEQVGEHAEFIINSWQSGSRMTGLNFLSGISAITPHPVAQYSKPIVVLVNELNFSCGDLFPAILQDNNRAKIFGVTTAGAGGHVRKYEYPSSAGVAFISLTASIAHRTSGPVVENLGVTPNHEYRVNLKDLQNNYGNYIDELKKVIYSIM